MRYYRLVDNQKDERLVARDGAAAYDLTAVKPELETFLDLICASRIAGTDVDDLVRRFIDEAPQIPSETLEEGRSLPVIPEEVWAAGVTYEISEEARKEESSMPDIYLDVYGAERPELFFKATLSRTVGPDEAIGIREDSSWNVPEPELGIVLYRGEAVGYTVGNDVSSREIEGANPLYLPQAKVYDRSCAIGPCVVSPGSVTDPSDLEMRMTITRDGDTIYDDSTSTGKMVRSHDDLISHFRRHNVVPELAVLLTGTSLVPDDQFTLREGDHVSIHIEGIGKLSNDVITV